MLNSDPRAEIHLSGSAFSDCVHILFNLMQWIQNISITVFCTVLWIDSPIRESTNFHNNLQALLNFIYSSAIVNNIDNNHISIPYFTNEVLMLCRGAKYWRCWDAMPHAGSLLIFVHLHMQNQFARRVTKLFIQLSRVFDNNLYKTWVLWFYRHFI